VTNEGVQQIEWVFSYRLPISLTPSVVLFDNIAGIYYLMAAYIKIPSRCLPPSKSKDPIEEQRKLRSFPIYIVIDGISKEKHSSLIDRPSNATFNMTKRLYLWQSASEFKIWAKTRSENLFIGYNLVISFGMKAHDPKNFLPTRKVSIKLMQELTITTPIFKKEIASMPVLEKNLTAIDLARNSSLGEVNLTIRIPSWRQQMETSPSIEGQTITVVHYILLTFDLTIMASVDIKLPITLWPRKIE